MQRVLRRLLSSSAAAPGPLANLKYRNKFVDYAKIKVVAGHGGNGCSSFRREKYVERGGPDGGDGGKGGDVVFQSVKSMSMLGSVLQHYTAGKGENGKGRLMHGKDGKDVVIDVPVGTVIRSSRLFTTKRDDDNSGGGGDIIFEAGVSGSDSEDEDDDDDEDHDEDEDKAVEQQELMVADLDKPGMRVVVCRGGKGGMGNPHFASSTQRAPRKATRGEEGVACEVELELKTIADVGLVGLPNAGKSTFLRAVSNAHPRVAPYPFTTLNPFIGTIDFRDYYQITMADIPGLIAGAHLNVGLGHRFLRHIERASVLVYVVDISGGVVGPHKYIDDCDRGEGELREQVDWDALELEQQQQQQGTRQHPLGNWKDAKEFMSTQRQPWDDLATLQQELEQFRPGLSKKPSVVIANKMDIKGPDDLTERNLAILRQYDLLFLFFMPPFFFLTCFCRKTNLTVIPVSAINGENVTAVTSWLRVHVQKIKAEAEYL